MAIGVGVFSNFLEKLDYPASWPGATAATEFELSTTTINPTVSIRPSIRFDNRNAPFMPNKGQYLELSFEQGWGTFTYPKAEGLREAAATVPAALLLVETDSPFLAPQPLRGKPNQPANVVATAQVVAEARGVSYERLERTVEENAARVFGW